MFSLDWQSYSYCFPGMGEVSISRSNTIMLVGRTLLGQAGQIFTGLLKAMSMQKTPPGLGSGLIGTFVTPIQLAIGGTLSALHCMRFEPFLNGVLLIKICSLLIRAVDKPHH